MINRTHFRCQKLWAFAPPACRRSKGCGLLGHPRKSLVSPPHSKIAPLKSHVRVLKICSIFHQMKCSVFFLLLLWRLCTRHTSSTPKQTLAQMENRGKFSRFPHCTTNDTIGNLVEHRSLFPWIGSKTILKRWSACVWHFGLSHPAVFLNFPIDSLIDLQAIHYRNCINIWNLFSHSWFSCIITAFGIQTDIELPMGENVYWIEMNQQVCRQIGKIISI